jgi:prepilin-type N-terminal cleavage/methylation domain-containing protein
MRTLLRRMLSTLKARHARRGRRVSEAGMTLVEIMIVVAIMTMLTSLIGYGVFDQWKKSQAKTARIQVERLAGKVKMFKVENNGKCPSMDELIPDQKQRLDPWGENYVFTCGTQDDPDSFEIFSKGPDRKDATQDDIKALAD